MFPPGGGGNDPRMKQVATALSRQRPGGLAQGGAPSMGGGGGAPTPTPAQSVGDHLAEAYRGIVKQEPGAMESLKAFFLALQELGGGAQGQPSPAGNEVPQSAGFPGIAPGSAQSVPSNRAPIG